MRALEELRNFSKMYRLVKPNISEDAIAQVADVIRSGNLVQGKNVGYFEKALAEYLSVKHVVVCSSGTAALHLSLLATNINAGDEVICPAFTFPATANVIERCGAKVVLADISSADLCLEPGEFQNAITKKTKAVIIVHEFGQAAQIEELVAIAEKHGVKIIEDAACAIGTTYKGNKVGTLGLAGCFSFHPRKVITTGEGGAVVTNDESIAEKLRVFRNHGISINDGNQNFIEAGLNYRMTEFQAVLGFYQLAGIGDIIDNRLTQAKLYNTFLANTASIRTPRKFEDRSTIYQTYHVVVADNINRNELIECLRAADIEANIGAQALNCLNYYQKKYGYKPEDFPNTTRAYRQGLALPIGPHLTKGDIQYIAKTLINLLDNYED